MTKNGKFLTYDEALEFIKAAGMPVDEFIEAVCMGEVRVYSPGEAVRLGHREARDQD